MMWKYPWLERVWPWRRRHDLQANIDDLLYEEIRTRRSEQDSGQQHEDVLADFLSHEDKDGQRMSDQELRDQLITLLIAGHETTAAALAWVFERLMRSPDKLARLRSELDAGEDDAYLDAVIKETLRVRPVIFQAFARKLTAPMELGGYQLPEGIKVTPAVGLVQSCEGHHPDATEFRPERFLEGQSPAPYTWIPFGGGPRRCLGAAFATFEMKVVLRTILTQVELRAPTNSPERVRLCHPTQIPAKGAETVLLRRLTPTQAEPKTQEG
jgi:cytochrome P450